MSQATLVSHIESLLEGVANPRADVSFRRENGRWNADVFDDEGEWIFGIDDPSKDTLLSNLDAFRIDEVEVKYDS